MSVIRGNDLSQTLIENIKTHPVPLLEILLYTEIKWLILSMM